MELSTGVAVIKVTAPCTPPPPPPPTPTPTHARTPLRGEAGGALHWGGRHQGNSPLNPFPPTPTHARTPLRGEAGGALHWGGRHQGNSSLYPSPPPPPPPLHPHTHAHPSGERLVELSTGVAVIKVTKLAIPLRPPPISPKGERWRRFD